MPSDCAVRIIRSVISPRLAIRILLKGGFSTLADDDDDDAAAAGVAAAVDENVRLEMIEEEVVVALMMLLRSRPSQAARSNNSLEEDILSMYTVLLKSLSIPIYVIDVAPMICALLLTGRTRRVK